MLAVHDDVGTLRLVRETLAEFTECDLDTSPKSDYAFELALQREYSLFIFNLSNPLLGGELLYDLISKAYTHCHAGARTAPAVVYLAESNASGKIEELQREARVKAVLMLPLTIDRILGAVEGTIGRKK